MGPAIALSVVLVVVWAHALPGCGRAGGRPPADAGNGGGGSGGLGGASGTGGSTDGGGGTGTDGGETGTDGGETISPNPPVPEGWRLMPQAEVTADMTQWAVTILHDPATYPMFSTAMQTFGGLMVLARVEWHPPDFQNSAIHRGVTLYEPAT